MAPVKEEPLLAEAVEEGEPPMEPQPGLNRGRNREADDIDDDRSHLDDRDERPRRREERHDLSHDDDEAPRRGMPGSVILAIVALSLELALQLTSILVVLFLGNLPPEQQGNALAQWVGGLVIGGLILWGMVAGHRLAWQWGRILGIIGAVLLLLAGGGALAGAGSPDLHRAAQVGMMLVGAVTLFYSACLFTIFFSLGTKSAKLHFRLRCPACGKFTNKAADFFFNRAKCKNCGETW